MRHAGRQDGNDACVISDGGAVIDTDAGAGNDFVRFQLRLVDMIANLFAGRDADKVIAELSRRLLGGDDVLEFHAFKFRVL